MDVSEYLSANVHKFNVKLLETVFDVQNMGKLLDSKDTIEFMRKIEQNINSITGIKGQRIKIQRKTFNLILNKTAFKSGFLHQVHCHFPI